LVGLSRGLLARLPVWFAIAFCAAFVLLPLLRMLLDTVWDGDGFTLSAWGTILASEVDRSQLAYSLALGVCATAIACGFGFLYAWWTCGTDLPAGAVLGPLGIAPLVIPPIVVAMGFTDFVDASGFFACAGLLGLTYAPFVAVLTARGLRAVDGRLYEAASVARGRRAADRLLVRMVLPEVLAGCLFAFIFVVSEHGVPEFLTVKGKTWHTYAEGVFARWTRRATGVEHEALVSPIVAAVPLVLVVVVALFFALRFRARRTIGGDFVPLPVRRLGALRWPKLLLPLTYLAAGVGVPVAVMGLWAAGSTQVNEPISLGRFEASLRGALAQAEGDLAYTVGIAAISTVVLILVAVPLARIAARKREEVDYFAVLPIAVPAVLLGIGLVQVYNSKVAGRVYDQVGDFYDSWGIVACAYAARFLPFGVLTLSHATRRIDRSLEEAALLSGRGPVARAARIHVPLALPAIASAACLVWVLALRELDVAVVLPAGNGTVVRRLSNIVHFGGEDTGGALALFLLLAAVLVPLLIVLATGRRLRSLS
jgi:iron(III) transport system permease protein